MALSAATIFEVRSATGSDTNGGGFVEGSAGTDYSQQDSANSGGSNRSTADASSTGSTGISSVTASFTAALVGNVIYLAGGSGSLAATRRQVVSVTDSQNIIVDAAVAAGTGITMNIGGALQTTQGLFAGGLLVSGMSIFAKGTEARATAMTAIPTGIRFVGYSAVRGDGGKYTIQATAGMGTILSNSSNAIYENLLFDGNGQTITNTFVSFTGGNSSHRNLEVKGVAGAQKVADLRGAARQIWLHDNLTTGAILSPGAALEAEEIEMNGNLNASQVLTMGSLGMIALTHFLIYANGGDGVLLSGSSPLSLNNGVIYGQGGNAINCTSSIGQIPGFILDRVILQGCTGKAIAMTNNVSQKFKVRLRNSVYEYNNGGSSAGNYDGTLGLLGGDPFVAAAAGNFAISPAAVDFASLRNVGFSYPRGTTVDYGDAGAAQRLVASAGGGGRLSLGI
jgi:hypothetical protein